MAMYHTIEFITHQIIDLAISPRQPIERVLARKGMRVHVQLRPHVVETPDGLVDAADLFFEDGYTAHAVAFAQFRFVD
jgi:hypothetical protein